MSKEYSEYLNMLEKTLEKHNVNIDKLFNGSVVISKNYYNKQTPSINILNMIVKHKENPDEKNRVNFSPDLTVINKKLIRHLAISNMDKNEKENLVNCLFSEIPLSYFKNLIAQDNKEIFLYMLSKEKNKNDSKIFHHLHLLNYYKLSKEEKKNFLLEILENKKLDYSEKENVYTFIRLVLKEEDWLLFKKYLPEYEDFLTLSENKNYTTLKETFSTILEIDYESIYKSHAKFINENMILPLVKQILLALKFNNGFFEFKNVSIIENNKEVLFLSVNKFDDQLLKKVFDEMLNKVLKMKVEERKNLEKLVLPTVLELNLKENTKKPIKNKI